MPLRCAHLLFIVHLSQVTAVDLDGPPNNFIFYSIVSGNPKQQFSIDPRSGHITVRSMLDREEVSSVEFGEEMGQVQAECMNHRPQHVLTCFIRDLVVSALNALIKEEHFNHYCSCLTGVIDSTVCAEIFISL